MAGNDSAHLLAAPRWPPRTLMARLDGPAGDELLHLVPGRLYPLGAVLISQGDEGRHVYLLRPAPYGRSACVKVTARLANGAEALLGIRMGGDVVGELAVLGHRPRTATVTACSPLIGHAIPADVFTAFLQRRPAAWSAVSLMIADRLEWANRRRVDYGLFKVEGAGHPRNG